MNKNLRNTENRLVRIFLLWAFVFLIIFECIFTFGKHYIEKNNQEKRFIHTTDLYLSGRPIDKNFKPLFGAIITDNDGKIIKSMALNIEEAKNLKEIFTQDVLSDLNENISYNNNLMIRKVTMDSWVVYYFFDNAYDNMNLVRSLILFLILDIILLTPIWFLSKYYIRRILRPIQENIDTMTHFVHDAGHELKTPLAIMSWNLQLMRDLNKPDYSLIESSLETVESMNESIEWLLELADLKMPDSKIKSNIYNLVDEEIKRVKNPNNIKIYNHISKNNYVLANEKHLSIILRNLIENAVKYNKENWKVDIYYDKNILTIKDTWIGMNESDLSRIFDRFYRINKHAWIQGSGIWLTLVHKVVSLYDWDIIVESKLWEGSKFSIKF